MKPNLTLLKIISLATLTIGILAPAKIAEAGSAPTTNKASEKLQTVKGQESTGEYHAAAKKHGAVEHGGSSSIIPEVFLTKKAIRIEFITFLSLIGASIIIPEFFYKPKKNSQSTKHSESHHNQPEHTNDIDSDNFPSKVDYDQLKPFILSTNNSQAHKELDDQSRSDHTAA